MANYLSGKYRKYWDKHEKRQFDRTVTAGKRAYSRAWCYGFDHVWIDDGVPRDKFCKNKFEKTAFNRGASFAKRIEKL